MKLKQAVLAIAVVGAFAIYAFRQHFGQAESLPTDTTVPIISSVPTSTPADIPSAVVVPSPTPRGRYKDGTYTGSPADAFYGTVQVKAVIAGGKITDIQFLQYPNDRGHSVEINTYATPILRSEAIQAQNARVNVVSGATQTSQAFVQSLSAALQQAS